MWCPGSGVVLDCIDLYSLPSFLLSSNKGKNGFALYFRWNQKHYKKKVVDKHNVIEYS